MLLRTSGATPKSSDRDALQNYRYASGGDRAFMLSA